MIIRSLRGRILVGLTFNSLRVWEDLASIMKREETFSSEGHLDQRDIDSSDNLYLCPDLVGSGPVMNKVNSVLSLISTTVQRFSLPVMLVCVKIFTLRSRDILTLSSYNLYLSPFIKNQG
jgi:hypothetical protein